MKIQIRDWRGTGVPGTGLPPGPVMKEFDMDGAEVVRAEKSNDEEGNYFIVVLEDKNGLFFQFYISDFNFHVGYAVDDPRGR